jgi:hypothetical protein
MFGEPRRRAAQEQQHPHRRLWPISQWQTGQTITWHNGQTTGYTSYLGLDRAHRRAVTLLSDVAVDPGLLRCPVLLGHRPQ